MNTRSISFSIIFFFGMILTACGPAAEQASQTGEETSGSQEQPQSGTPMSGLPLEKLESVYQTADYADYIFYQPSFSMSQDETASIRMALGFIGSQPATLNPACQPRGRVFFQQNGTDILVADIYMGDGCNYFVFIENDEPKYANQMTDQGIQYLQNNINQVLEMQRQATQGQ